MKFKLLILFLLLAFNESTKTIDINEQNQVVDISDLTQEKDGISKILNKLKAENVYFVMFTFIDLLGNLKEVVIPIDQINQALQNGLTFDGSSITGYTEINQSDMIIKPDLTTLRFIPWLDETQKTAWLICNVYKNKNEEYEADPRFILKKACNELKELGLQLNVGVELEFFMLKNKGAGPGDFKPCDNKKYFDTELLYSRQQENHILMHALKGLGVNVQKLHHEVAPGQHEISLEYSNALEMADQIIVAKYAATVMAKQLNYIVTFMPKPIFGQNGSGMHIHYSLFDINKKRNIFYCDKTNDGASKNSETSCRLSEIAKKFLAGNMFYMKELAPLFNPTINSYKRLIPGYEAPVYICWSALNRSSMFRIPLMHNNEVDGMRVELRCPDSSCNPYLALAALIKSGLEGIKQNKLLKEPICKNLFKLTKEEVKSLKIKTYPTNLSEALDKFENSTLAKETLGKKCYEEFLKLKRKECSDFNKAITDWELQKYL